MCCSTSPGFKGRANTALYSDQLHCDLSLAPIPIKSSLTLVLLLLLLCGCAAQTFFPLSSRHRQTRKRATIVHDRELPRARRSKHSTLILFDLIAIIPHSIRSFVRSSGGARRNLADTIDDNMQATRHSQREKRAFVWNASDAQPMRLLRAFMLCVCSAVPVPQSDRDDLMCGRLCSLCLVRS